MREVTRYVLTLIVIFFYIKSVEAQNRVDIHCGRDADYVLSKSCVRIPSCKDMSKMEFENDSAFYFGIPLDVLDPELQNIGDSMRVTFTRCKNYAHIPVSCAPPRTYLIDFGKNVYGRYLPSCFVDEDKQVLNIRQGYWRVYENYTFTGSIRLRKWESYIVWIGTQKMLESGIGGFPIKIDVK